MKPIALGKRGFHVSVSEFNSTVKIHIRKHFRTDSERLIPTRFGVALNEDEFQTLGDNLIHINKKVKKLKKRLIKTKNSSTSSSKEVRLKNKKNEKKKSNKTIKVHGSDSDSGSSSKGQNSPSRDSDETTVLESDYSDFN